MSSEPSDKNFGYNSGYTSKKDTTKYFVNIKKKTNTKAWFAKIGKTRLIIICAALLLIVISCITIIIILTSQSSDSAKNAPKEDAYSVLEKYDDDLANYMNNGGSDEWFTKTTNNLINFINSNDDMTVTTRATITLANFYSAKGSFQESADILNRGLQKENMSDQNTLSLLTTLADLYTATGRQEDLIDTITRIINLPDDMKLEQGDWSSTKSYYEEQLRQLTKAGE